MLYLFIIPFIVWVVVQLVKLCIDLYNTKKFSIHNLWVSGWFPSVHGALSSSVTTLIALHDGLQSTIFAIAITLSFLFRYDAMNVRYESGQHAQYINKMRSELQGVLDEEKKATMSNLKERIGHTPLEVLWWIVFWVWITILVYYFIYIPSL